MLYSTISRINWEHREHAFSGECLYRLGVRAVSRKHALNKAFRAASSLPCVTDRDPAEWRIEVETRILEGDE
jgi:hypothetical protein